MFQRPKMLQYLSHIRKELVVGSLWKFLRGLIREKQLHGFPKDCPQQICAAVARANETLMSSKALSVVLSGVG